MKTPQFHARDCAGITQSLAEHLTNVGEGMKCRVPDPLKMLAYATGLLHDFGKYNKEWQLEKLINKSNKKINHAAQGALFLYTWLKEEADICLPIAGHHTELKDKGTLNSSHPEFNKSLLIQECNNFKKELSIPTEGWNIPLDYNSIDNFLATKIIYSLLIDEDSLDAQKFEEKVLKTNKLSTIRQLIGIYNNQNISNLFKSIKPNYKKGDFIRDEFFSCVSEAAKLPKGFYTLTGPTGVGKFQSCFNYGLEATIKHNMNGVIYVAPYISIIQQAANNCKSILGDRYKDLVLEHHSNFDPNPDDDIECWEDELEKERIFKQICSNWDAPIILTTGVQFLTTLFGNKRRQNRKLNQLQNRVIIIDETQVIPITLLIPTMFLLKSLVDKWGASVLLTTATQPSADNYQYKGINIFKAPQEIIPAEKMYAYFSERKTCTYKDLGKIEWDDIPLITSGKRALVICEKAEDVQQIFKYLGDDFLCLTARMCGRHRQQVLDRVYKSNCSLIATRVVEAGVDLDFPFVMREITAKTTLDSVVQAAGRCNREKLRAVQDSIVGMFRVGIEDCSVLNLWNIYDFNDPAQLSKAIHQSFTDKSDKEYMKTATEYLKDIENKKYETVNKTIAENIIGKDYTSVFVEYDSVSANLISKLEKDELGRSGFRKLQQYTASVPKHWTEGSNKSLVKKVGNVLLWRGKYDSAVGCVLDNGCWII